MTTQPVQMLPRLSPERLSEIDRDLFDQSGFLHLFPAEKYDAMPWAELRAWLHERAIYGLPTTELCAWLRKFQGEHLPSTIELGAGGGHLAHHLGIPAYDSMFQASPLVQALYAAQGQPTVQYGSNVQPGDAVEVAARLRPHTALFQWVSQKVGTNDPVTKPGCFGGVDFEKVLSTVKRLILVGSHPVHGDFDIMKRTHTAYTFPGIRSRNEKNTVYVWENE